MTVAVRRVGIVLAGGEARRFGRDKLAEPVRGRPMLEHVILAIAPLVDEILVVGSAGPASLPATAATPVRRLTDEQPGAGPLAALATALDVQAHGTAIVAAGDMPDLAGPVLGLLLEAVEQRGAQAAVLVVDGTVVPLPAALDVEAAAPAARAALAARASSLRSLLDRLRVERIEEDTWRALDPDGRTPTDVDREADLPETERRPQSRRASCGR